MDPVVLIPRKLFHVASSQMSTRRCVARPRPVSFTAVSFPGNGGRFGEGARALRVARAGLTEFEATTRTGDEKAIRRAIANAAPRAVGIAA
jgi:hypothetical protein